MGWLLDTNILAELRRPKPEPKVLSFIARSRLEDLFISDVTVAEIRFGIEQAGEPLRGELSEWLRLTVRPKFAGRILPITEDIMLRWRLLLAAGRRAGHTYSQPDLIIAATALHHNLTTVTRDRREFDHAGAPVFNPWE